MTDMNLLAEVKEISTELRGNSDSGTHYLLGWMWATLTPKQQKELAESFREQLAEELER